MKYSANKVPSAKLNSTSSNTLVKPGKPKKVQRKTMEVSTTYCMTLRSGNTIKKSCYYYRSYSTRTRPGKTGGKLRDPCCMKIEQTESHEPPVTDLSACRMQISGYRENARRAQTNEVIAKHYKSLSTYNDKFITFTLEGGNYVINVEDLGKNQEKDRVLLRYYTSPLSAGNEQNGSRSMVNISPTKYNGLLLYANEEQRSVKLQRSEHQSSDQASFFFLHTESSECVSFECKNKSGTFLGVKDNHLALVERTPLGFENTLFKLLE